MTNQKKKYTYDIDEVCRLVEETDREYTDIALETGCPYQTVAYHGRKIRGISHKRKNNHQPLSFLHGSNVDDSYHIRTKEEIQKQGESQHHLVINCTEVSITEAEQVVEQMIQSARSLNLSKISISIS